MTTAEDQVRNRRNRSITCWSEKMHENSPSKWLKHERESKGLSVEAASSLLGIEPSELLDLESCDDEIVKYKSLSDLTHLCSLLGISILNLFPSPDSITPLQLTDLRDHIERHYQTKLVSVTQFEKMTGGELANFMSDPAPAIGDWNIDCLNDVCTAIGCDWRAYIGDIENTLKALLSSGRAKVHYQNVKRKKASPIPLIAHLSYIIHVLISLALAFWFVKLRINIVQTGNLDLRWQIIRYAIPLQLGVTAGFGLWLLGSVSAYSKAHKSGDADEIKAQWLRMFICHQLSPAIIIAAFILIWII